jgi:hypothetical protein
MIKDLRVENRQMKQDLEHLTSSDSKAQKAAPVFGRRSGATAPRQQQTNQQSYNRPEETPAEIKEPLDVPGVSDEEILLVFYDYIEPNIATRSKVNSLINKFRQKWGGSRCATNLLPRVSK